MIANLSPPDSTAPRRADLSRTLMLAAAALGDHDGPMRPKDEPTRAPVTGRDLRPGALGDTASPDLIAPVRPPRDS